MEQNVDLHLHLLPYSSCLSPNTWCSLPDQVFAQDTEGFPLAFIKALTSPVSVVISPHLSYLRSNIFASLWLPHMNKSFYRLSYITCHFFTALSTVVTVCLSVQLFINTYLCLPPHRKLNSHCQQSISTLITQCLAQAHGRYSTYTR